MSLSHLRSYLITAPLILLATVALGTLSLMASFFDRRGHLQHRLARLWSRILLLVCGVSVRVEGLEKLNPRSSYVFVANHASYMDTPVVLGHIPVEFRFMAKKGLFLIPLLGWHLKRAGHLAVVRGDPRASARSMTEAARVIRKTGISVLVFAEGGRTPTGMREFREGAAYIAIKSGVPAVPLGVVGTRQVLPVGSGHVRGGPVILRVGDPVPTAHATLKDRSELTHLLRERVLELLGEPIVKPQETR